MAIKSKINQTVFFVGDTVRVHQIIKETDKERIQIFEGVVISIKGSRENKSFIVRRIASAGIGVERIWPINSPWIKKIEIIRHGKAKRAKLYFLRGKQGKQATRVKEDKKKLLSKKKEVKKIKENLKDDQQEEKPRQARRRTGKKTT